MYNYNWEECASELDRCVLGKYPDEIGFHKNSEKVIVLRRGKNSLYLQLAQRANSYEYSLFYYWYSTPSGKSKGGGPLRVHGSNMEQLLKFIFPRRET